MMRCFAISKLKAVCFRLSKHARMSSEPVAVSQDTPISQRSLPEAIRPVPRRLGGRAGQIQVLGDIEAPAADPAEWDALR